MSDALIDRLTLTASRLSGMSADLRTSYRTSRIPLASASMRLSCRMA
jgi:gamma-glutamyl phosphate reductase